MMQMRFTRFAPQRDRYATPEGASAREIAIGQLLGLAASAGFRFDAVDGELVPISDDADYAQAPILETCLRQIGIEEVMNYLDRNTPHRLAAVSAAAP